MSDGDDEDFVVSSTFERHCQAAIEEACKRSAKAKQTGFTMDQSARVKDNNCQSMLWRLSPTNSFSDWTLEIKRTGSARVDTYHVHRFFLALGPRSSQYFASMLTSTLASFAETQASTSQLPLDDPVADAVPDLLDFMYNPAGKCHIHSNNAVSLYYLADYLQMPPHWSFPILQI